LSGASCPDPLNQINERVFPRERPGRRNVNKDAVSWKLRVMANIATIGQQPAEGASAPQKSVPQAPPDGLLVTESAVRRIRVLLDKEGISPAEGGLRLGVKGGGCSGLSYAMSVDAHSRDNDNIFEFNGVRVFVDPKSFVFLRGLTLDYEETLIRQGFNYINPNSTRSCGCGTSFSV